MKMSLSRPKVCFFLCFVIILLGAGSGYPQDDPKYPSKPISFLNNVLPGGPTDLACRVIAKDAEKFLGQPLVIVNKPGGAASLAVATTATAKPDGYTIVYGAHTALFITPYLEKLPYNPVRDLRYIMQFGVLNFGVIVPMDAPFKKWEDLLTFARQNPKKATYGTSGTNTMHNVIMEEIAKKEGVQFAHMPFTSGPESQAALLGGHLVFVVGDFPYALVEAKKVRLLLLLKEEPLPDYPDIPILKDFGYTFPFPTALNVAAPKGISDGIANKLEDAFTKAMKEPGFIKGMKDLRLPLLYRNSKDLTAYVAKNYEMFGKILKDRGLIK
jgi:tripartite-type tricarboxylate transporter receptor subunit TctC